MNCRAIEPLLLAERDGVLTSEQRSALVTHVASCVGCRQLRTTLGEALDNYQADAARIAVPDAAEVWRELSATLPETTAKPAKRRPLAPIIWFGAPLATAAAIAFAFFLTRPTTTHLEARGPVAENARADYVEAGDASASTLVYVDEESGWLVVWAADSESKPSG